MSEIFNEFASRFDNARQAIMRSGYDALIEDLSIGYEQDIVLDSSVAVVGDNDLAKDFVNNASEKYQIVHLPYISEFSGAIGRFTLRNLDGEFSASQIVFFTNFSIVKEQLGVVFANDYESESVLCEALDEFIGEFSFEKTIFYDEKKCQYFHRNKNEYSYCGSCADICPNMAISRDDEKRELIFSDIDCIYCGKCVGVCPSGAMQKANAPLHSLNKALRFYKDKIPLFLSHNDLAEFEPQFVEKLRNLPSDFIPLILPNINMLNEVYFLNILQESARACVILGERSEILQESVDFINAVYERLFGKKAVFAFEELDSSDFANVLGLTFGGYHYEVEESDFTRATLSERLKFFVKEGDFGVVENTKNILYTNLKIDSKKCTLCMSCVESCNAKALINSKDNFSLLLNPSLCTACGVCVDICPENVIEMPLGRLELNGEFFKYREVAKDEPFACVECGKVFASAKSIKKVESLMLPIFGNDEIKKRTLRCCSDCKVRVMFKS